MRENEIDPFLQTLQSVSSDILGVRRPVTDLMQRLAGKIRTPREDRIYLHLCEAANALTAAIADCQVEREAMP